jgi:hypothetical protein
MYNISISNSFLFLALHDEQNCPSPQDSIRVVSPPASLVVNPMIVLKPYLKETAISSTGS